MFRAALFQAFFYGFTTVYCLIAGIPVRLFARHRALALAHVWIRIILGGARVICGIRIEVSGRDHLPADGAMLIACQHQSVVDTLLWFTLVPCPSYVMKRELTRVPVFGPLLVDSGMVPVDRDAGAAALRLLLQETSRLVAEGRQIVIFPEGTRVPPGERVALQPGVAALARHTGLAVIPVSLDSGWCWGRRALDMHAGTIHVTVHPPIPAGTPRGPLLAGIENAWRHDDTRCLDPVDKSVDEHPVQLMFTVK